MTLRPRLALHVDVAADDRAEGARTVVAAMGRGGDRGLPSECSSGHLFGFYGGSPLILLPIKKSARRGTEHKTVGRVFVYSCIRVFVYSCIPDSSHLIHLHDPVGVA